MHQISLKRSRGGGISSKGGGVAKGSGMGDVFGVYGMVQEMDSSRNDLLISGSFILYVCRL